MIDQNEGWAATERGNVFHYTTQPGETEPAWDQLDPKVAIPFRKLVMVSPTEGWAIGITEKAPYIHYRDGQWQSIGGECCTRDLAMISPDEGWAVGDYGRIDHYTQGKWQIIVPAGGRGDPDLRNIAMLNAAEGWATGSNTTFFHFEGQQWQRLEPEALGMTITTSVKVGDEPSQQSINSPFIAYAKLEKVGELEIWAAGDGVYRYKDGRWQIVDIAIEGIIDFSMINSEEGWATGDYGKMYHYQNGSWEEATNPSTHTLRAIDMVNTEEGWAMGDNSTILHYQGGLWQTVDEAAPTPKLTDIAWVEGGTPWAVGADLILRYVDNTWRPISTPFVVGGLEAIDMVSAEEGWAVGLNGTILHYSQGNWQSVSSPTAKGIADIDMINEQEGWAVGEEGLILHYLAGEWREVASPTQELLTSVSMSSERDGWAVGFRGVILHYHDGSWEVIPGRIEEDWREVQMFSPTEGWARSSGVLLHYHDNIWEQVALPDAAFGTIGSMMMISPDEGWVLKNPFALHYQQGEWEIVELPVWLNFTSIVMEGNEGWAVGEGILHYTNK
jgi:photosystem II stability/assembly factor-like uncharacterized protein